MTRIAYALVLVALLVGDASAASAQTDVAIAAREAFLAGRTASNEERWSDALRHFRQAFVLTGSPVARYNEGFVLRALGRFREARDIFDEVVSSPDLDEATRSTVRELRADVAAHIAQLTLEGLDAALISVRVDAEERTDDGTRPLILDVDPGARVLALRREDYEPFEWTGTLDDHQRLTLTVAMTPTPHSIFEEPWIWIGVGVVLLAGAAIAIWAYDDSLQLRPESSRVVRF